jgi:hypothetical protein
VSRPVAKEKGKRRPPGGGDAPRSRGRRRLRPLGIERPGGRTLLALPVLHYRVEFAEAARAAFLEDPPDAVAVELPGTLEKAVVRAVRRLPAPSAVTYEGKGGVRLYVPIEPADAVCEALRSALEHERPFALVDPDLDYPLRQREPWPDPYAVRRAGLAAYVEQVRRHRPRSEPDTRDLVRERGMALELQRLLDEHRCVLFVCGLEHLDRVLDELDRPQAEPLAPTRPRDAQVLNLHPDSVAEVLGEFPLLQAVYETRRRGLPPEPEALPARRRRARPGFTVIDGGRADPSRDPEAPLAAALPWIARRCTGRRADHRDAVDRMLVHWELVQHASRFYHDFTGETVWPWQRRVLFRFARRYARLEGRLLPDLFQLAAAARGSADDNLAWEVWSLGTYYPWAREQAEVPTVRISGEDLFLGEKRMRIVRRRPRRKRRPVGLPRRRKSERFPGEWDEAFRPDVLCSYPPEDLVVEDFGRFLQKKGVVQLSEERSRVEPFTTSLLDGVDVRETLRNWHERRIYVREIQPVRGGVGSVVVIFDEDESRYPQRMTWHGEHEQESDMAYYATDLEGNLVGPGIARCEYGGFLMTYPPRRLFDVWRDPDYTFARSGAERLLLAALDYSVEKFVVYVAARPPRSWFQLLAGRIDRKIVYIPIGSLSPVTLKKIRAFHVLSGRDKREVAKEYLV